MPPSSVFNVAGRVIKATVAAPLVAGLRRPFRGAFAPATAVDLAAVVGLAERNDRRAHRAADPHENLRPHARTSTAARTEVAPPVRSQAPSPGQRPRATRGLRIPTPGPSSISRSPIDYEVTRPSASSWRCADSSGSRRSLTAARRRRIGAARLVVAGEEKRGRGDEELDSHRRRRCAPIACDDLRLHVEMLRAIPKDIAPR